MHISEKDLERLAGLHEQSLHLQAYNLARTLGPLDEWEGTEAILTASNLAHNLGAVATASRLAAKAWRHDQKHPRALFYFANDAFHRKGALPALAFVKKHDAHFQADEKIRSWWYCLHAEIYAALRDFKSADAWHQKALDTAPAESWGWVSKAHSLELQDRYEESLDASRRAMKLDGGHRSSVYQTAHLLALLERYDEALEILTDAATRLENAWVVRQLADLQASLEMYPESHASFERLLELTPLREEGFDKYIYGRLSDTAYLCGDIPKAVHFAEKSASPFHLKIKERLENLNGTEKRVRLKLGFVRQHHVTCAPATLSNIARFWGKKAAHLEIADEMCYDGTPAYKERQWANRNGWETREFTLNWDDAVALIDRGVPFTLATIQPGNGHLQAVVGYDDRRKTFLIRDPFYQHVDEYAAAELLENQKSSGPRGMALVPREKAALLENLELRESRPYDFHFAVDGAIEAHDRERAVEILTDMEREFPGHRLTWSARWALALYDANNPKLREAVENLTGLFPEDLNLKLSHLSVSSEFVSRAERLKKLEEFAKDEKTDPLFWQMLGYELGADANRHGRALRWLYKALRALPSAGLTYKFIADIFWSKRRFAEAAELYRFAAGLNDKDEQFSYSYFLAMRFLKREEEALQFLRDRFARFGHRSNLPVRSLFHALRELGRTVEAFETLDAALVIRPEDGELRLFAADAKQRFGRREESAALLRQAENRAPRGIWLKNAALIAEQNGNLSSALAYWREAAALEPTAYDVHENIAFLLSALEGKKSSQEYLRKITRQFPFNLNLQKLRLNYLREETTEAIAVLRDLIRVNPQDAWCRRELARWLCAVKKFDSALENARAALAVDPSDPANHWSVGAVLAEMNETDEAAQHFERALSLSVDADYALNSWMNVCRTSEEKNAVLRFMRGELDRQVNFGAGLIAFREQAKRILEPKELLGQLRQFHRANPDYWFSLAAIVEQLADMHELDEALELAEKNTKRFPLIPQVWHDLAMVHKLRGENEREIAALRAAVDINVNWSFGIQQLVEALQRAGDFAQAKVVLSEALTRMPLDHFLHGYLAEVQWKLGEKEAALETARRAVAIEPEYEWAWRVIKDWSEELQRPELAAEMARELTVKKPKDSRVWIIYAQILESGQFSEKQLAAAEEALKLEPQNTLALAIKANSLADARRFDEAIAVCRSVSENGRRHEQLCYVQAGIEAARGNYEESIRQLEELTKRSPDYYPAYEKLAGIYREWDDKKLDYLRVTRAMTRLAPQEATVFGYLGEAFLLNRRRADAKKAFRQAFSLSPDYGFAGASLFDLHFEDGEMEECRNVVEMLRRFVPNENSLVRETVFRAKDGDWEAAARLWRELCLSEKAIRPHFEFVLQKFKGLNLSKQEFVLDTLRDASFEPDANALVGAYFIERCRQTRSERECLEYIESLPPASAVWAKAAGKYMELLLASDLIGLHKFIQKNRRSLKENHDAWAATGYILNASGEFKDGAEWFADWRQRAGVEPWMLWNYSIILRRLKKEAEARAVHEAAAQMPGNDETVSLHLMMLGLEALHAGDYETAARRRAQIAAQVMDEWDGFFYFLLEKGLEIQRLHAAGDAQAARAATKEMVKNALSVPDIWTDNIKSAAFDRSLGAALEVNQSLALTLALRGRALVSRIGI
ncbi:MAG TPA: C39 family peptidase [Pyrinomonadaceae bacterium]|jgi:predicted Zn-dependent protease